MSTHDNLYCTSLPSSKKRKMDLNISSEDDHLYLNNNVQPSLIAGRHFLPIQHQAGVFVADEWRPDNSHFYKPVTEDLLVNVHKAEQFSCGEGSHFVADSNGIFSHKEQGKVLQVWKYDKATKKLFISRSFLFTNMQAFTNIVHQLQQM